MEKKAVAFNLMWKFYKDVIADEEKARQCSLIAINEILNNYEEKYKYCKTKTFWEEVKIEINNLVFITEVKIDNYEFK